MQRTTSGLLQTSTYASTSSRSALRRTSRSVSSCKGLDGDLRARSEAEDGEEALERRGLSFVQLHSTLRERRPRRQLGRGELVEGAHVHGDVEIGVLGLSRLDVYLTALE